MYVAVCRCVLGGLGRGEGREDVCVAHCPHVKRRGEGHVVSSLISNFICGNKKQCSGKDVYTTCVCMYSERSHLINETFGFGREGGRGSKLVCHKLFLYVSNGLKHSPSFSTAHTQDLTELVAMCSSQQWSERRDGIAQLHILLESSRPFS